MSDMWRIHWFFGKFSHRYRLWYHRTHNNEYLWGIMQSLDDDLPVRILDSSHISRKDLDSLFDSIRDSIIKD